MYSLDNSNIILLPVDRCPNLQELVLPIYSTAKPRLKRAFQLWVNLESQHIGFGTSFLASTIFKNVRIYCLNLTVLKISCCVLNNSPVNSIINHMPGLKVLSLHCITIPRYGVVEILLNMPNLEEFHVSLLKFYNFGFLTRYKFALPLIEESRQQRRFSNLEVFHVCYWEECNTCVAATMGDPPLY